MWNGIKTITGYKDNLTVANTTDSTQPDNLNKTFACFDHQGGESRLHTALPKGNNPIVPHQHKFRSTLCRIS